MRQSDKNIMILLVIAVIGFVLWTTWEWNASHKAKTDPTTEDDSLTDDTMIDDPTENSSNANQSTTIIPTITTQELHRAVIDPRNDMTLIDARDQEQYNKNHIPGSYHIDTVDRSTLLRTVVLISNNGNEDLIMSTYRDLSSSHDVRNLTGGITAWQSDGFKLLSYTVSPDFVTSTKVQFIEPRDLQNIIQNTSDTDGIVIIDTRRKGNYENGHVAHAINIPFDEIEFRHREIPKQKKIFVYGAQEESSFQSGALLHDLDFLNIKTIKGGFAAWEQFGYPITKS